MHRHTCPENPNPKTVRTQNSAETKTIKSNNLTYLKTEKLCKHNLNKHILAKASKRNKEKKLKQEKAEKRKRKFRTYSSKTNLHGLNLTSPLS